MSGKETQDAKKGTEAMKIKDIRGGKGRFDGCTTTEEMAKRLKPGEALSLRTYGSGQQWEVRRDVHSVSQWSNNMTQGIVVTAQIDRS